MRLRKLVVLAVTYDPEQYDDPAGWDWAGVTDSLSEDIELVAAADLPAAPE